MINEVNYVLEGLSSESIDGEKELDNLLNELFRTDRSQKWTDADTPLNEVLFVKESKIYTFDDLDNRRVLKNHLKDLLVSFKEINEPIMMSNSEYKELLSNNQTFDFFVKNFFSVFCLLPFNYYEMYFMTDYTFDEFNLPLITKSFETMDMANLFALIYHHDEDKPDHIHGICYLDNHSRSKEYDLMFDVLQFISPMWPQF